MKDPRVGNHITRSMISENRKDVYDCLSGFLTPPTHWHDMNGLLFHYFGKLYHPGCKLFREKETALA
jgi:hypothetical protein